MANVSLVRVLAKLVEMQPDKYKFCEDFFTDFGTSNSIRNHAWMVAPSKFMGPLPEALHSFNLDYSKGMSVFKKYGTEGVERLLRGTCWSHFQTNYAILMRGDAIANFVAITGLEFIERMAGDIHAWKKTKRGKDLFISGLGSFNIPEAIQGLREARAEVGRHYGWQPNGYFFPKPYEITAFGYFKSTDHSLYGLIGTDKPLMKHLINYYSQWTAQLLGHLDEVVLICDQEEVPNLMITPPTRLVTYARERNIARRVEADAAINNTSPFRLRGLPAIGNLRQATSPTELIEVGVHLHNCVGGYNSTVRTGNSQIWLLEEDGVVVGVGELKLTGRNRYTWSQIRGDYNNALSTERHNQFLTALPEILESL